MEELRPDRSPLPQPAAKVLEKHLRRLRDHLVDAEQRFADDIAHAAANHTDSARNLIHYLALRGHDLRAIQQSLGELGLSSLGRCEGHVLESIEQLLRVMAILSGSARPPLQDSVNAGVASSRSLLVRNTELLLGSPAADRLVRIMVTMPSEAATDPVLVADLLGAGMDCMRINCAHDGPAAWEKMIANLRRAQRRTGGECKVLMDLAGPKLRTGAMAPGPRVLSWHPKRDERGRVRVPATVRLYASGDEPPRTTETVLPVTPGEFVRSLRPGDRIEFRDLRGKRRILRQGRDGVAHADASAWVSPGIVLHCGSKRARIGEVPQTRQRILLHNGDELVLTRAQVPGTPAHGRTAAHIPCSLPEVLEQLRAGESIWFDDGKLGGVIRSASRERAVVEITSARPGGFKLGADKGINLPASALHLPALTPEDRDNLPFVARHADLVGLSFVHEPDDVLALQSELVRLRASHLGVMLKIETRRAFEQLGGILITALRLPRVGVMIARGDLAVECGFERLAELQEEILWVCEAAHVPVVWATQVLETLTRKGLPSRAEITDAAMSERAECVMLNKGPHIIEAVRMLDGILRRMSAHQVKKTPTLRPLRTLRIA